MMTVHPNIYSDAQLDDLIRDREEKRWTYGRAVYDTLPNSALQIIRGESRVVMLHHPSKRFWVQDWPS